MDLHQHLADVLRENKGLRRARADDYIRVQGIMLYPLGLSARDANLVLDGLTA